MFDRITFCTSCLSQSLLLRSRWVNRIRNMYLIISSVEFKRVVSDIFGEIEFLMSYQNVGLHAYFALF